MRRFGDWGKAFQGQGYEDWQVVCLACTVAPRGRGKHFGVGKAATPEEAARKWRDHEVGAVHQRSVSRVLDLERRAITSGRDVWAAIDRWAEG